MNLWPVESPVAVVRRRWRDRHGALDPGAKIGVRGEQAAARLLRKKGLVVIRTGYRDWGGELDIIAVHRWRKTVVFVEVKSTASSKPGHPADRVTEDKQRRVAAAATRFMKKKRILGMPARFDVVAVWWPEGLAEPEKIEHYEAAFESPLESFW